VDKKRELKRLRKEIGLEIAGKLAQIELELDEAGFADYGERIEEIRNDLQIEINWIKEEE